MVLCAPELLLHGLNRGRRWLPFAAERASTAVFVRKRCGLGCGSNNDDWSRAANHIHRDGAYGLPGVIGKRKVVYTKRGPTFWVGPLF